MGLILLLGSAGLKAAEAGAFRSLASLRVPLEAAELGLSGAPQPWAEGASALALNPAALGRIQGYGLGLTHQFGLLGAGTEGIWLSLRPGDGWGQAFSYQHASQGRFERLDELGYPSGGQAEPWAMAARYGLAKSWNRGGLAAGAALGYLRQQVLTASTDLVELSLSADWRPVSRLGTALMLKGLSGPEGSSFEGVVSGAWEALGAGSHSLKGGVQVSFVSPGPVSPGLALVYAWRRRLAVRAGYEIPSVDGFRAANGMSLGLGFKVGEYGLDAAWKDQGELGSVQSVTLTRLWGGKSAPPASLNQARKLAREGKAREALWAYHGHLKAHPSDKMAWVEMADLYQGLGRLPEARACLERARALDPGDAELQRRPRGY